MYNAATNSASGSKTAIAFATVSNTTLHLGCFSFSFQVHNCYGGLVVNVFGVCCYNAATSDVSGNGRSL